MPDGPTGFSEHRDEAIGQAAVNTIISGSLVRVEGELEPSVLVWSATACEQVGRAVLNYLAQTPPGNAEDCRLAFEGWADEKSLCLDVRFFEGGNNYVEEDTRFAYGIWKSAIAWVAQL